MSMEWQLLRKPNPGKEDEVHRLYVEYFKDEPSGLGALFSIFTSAPKKDCDAIQRKIDAIRLCLKTEV